MSLDVYLYTNRPIPRKNSGIFVREDGEIREISREEWDYRNPGHEPVIANEVSVPRGCYSANITHNLGKMADAAGIYYHLWRPEEIGVTTARELIEPLREGLKKLRDDPAKYEKYNASNGWGLYKNFVPFVERYLAACEEYPEALVSVSR